MNKKAALNLGISTVVVLVIAMVVIGAGVSFIRTFFGAGTDSLLGAFEGVDDFGVQPDRSRPLVIDGGAIRVSQTGSTIVRVGYYNSDPGPLDVLIEAGSCTGGLNATIESLDQKIQPSSAGGFQVDFSHEGGLGGNTYICTISAKELGGKELTSTQVRVEVSS